MSESNATRQAQKGDHAMPLGRRVADDRIHELVVSPVAAPRNGAGDARPTDVGVARPHAERVKARLERDLLVRLRFLGIVLASGHSAMQALLSVVPALAAADPLSERMLGPGACIAVSGSVQDESR
jgi:hypothetical protein